MSLVRYLPTPSDRMGIITALLAVEQSVVLEYGPSGTTHYSMGILGKLGLPFHSRQYTTNMSDEDVVMGDVTRLEKAIKEIDEVYKPRVIFVVASSIAAVIGSDIEGICGQLQPVVKAKLIVFTSGGLGKDYSSGLAEANLRLVKALAEDGHEVQSDKYNLLGLSPLHFRYKSDLWEVSCLLEESLGLQLNCMLPSETSVEQIARIGEAAINIVLSYEALPAAKYLEESFGTPYVYVVPYGYSGSLELIQAIEARLDIKAKSEVLDRLKAKQQLLARLGLAPGPMRIAQHKPRAVLKGNYDTITGIKKLLETAGIEVEHCICSHSLKNVPSEGKTGIEYYPKEKAWADLIKNAHHTLVMGDGVVKQLSDASNITLFIAEPTLKRKTHATHLPLMGEKGADFLEEYIEDYFQSLGL